jgi:hypothetical protein
MCIMADSPILNPVAFPYWTRQNPLGFGIAFPYIEPPNNRRTSHIEPLYKNDTHTYKV